MPCWTPITVIQKFRVSAALACLLESIVQLANDLQVLLFPGLLSGQEQLDAISLPYWLGQKSASIFYRLRDYLEASDFAGKADRRITPTTTRSLQ